MYGDYITDEDGNVYPKGDEPPGLPYGELGYPDPNEQENDDDDYQEHDDD